MRHSYLLLFFLIIINSCKEKSSPSGVESKILIDSVGSQISTQKDTAKTNKEIINFIIQRGTSKEVNILPLGYPKVREIKSAVDTIPDIYGEILGNINKSIDRLDFKNNNTGNTESLIQFIKKSKDSLNIALYHDYYSRLDKRSYFFSDNYIKSSDFKLFFLKTIYSRKYDGKKGVENIYLVSTKNNEIIDILNIYYHSVRTHSMESRFFYIDKDVKITSAIYSNIEGEISVRGFNEFVMDENGFFEVIEYSN